MNKADFFSSETLALIKAVQVELTNIEIKTIEFDIKDFCHFLGIIESNIFKEFQLKNKSKLKEFLKDTLGHSYVRNEIQKLNPDVMEVKWYLLHAMYENKKEDSKKLMHSLYKNTAISENYKILLLIILLQEKDYLEMVAKFISMYHISPISLDGEEGSAIIRITQNIPINSIIAWIKKNKHSLENAMITNTMAERKIKQSNIKLICRDLKCLELYMEPNEKGQKKSQLGIASTLKLSDKNVERVLRTLISYMK